MTTPQNHLDHLNQLLAETKPWHENFKVQFSHLAELKKSFATRLERFSAEENTLNIAIMGQVKAGKSSFLNALLFKGKPVLPVAATPKTASLTRISHGQSPRLEVEFLDIKSWQELVELAKEEDDDTAVKMAKEQVAMIEQAGIDHVAIIQAGVHQIDAQSVDELMKVMNDYAGNDGKYTALVKMIRLYLPDEELRGYNIIDTPGMNDPVLSRTQRTRDEMANSDVVFFLSRASNFLEASDMMLIGEQLPEAGVKQLVLVAGQYDSAIEQDGYDRDSLSETEANIQKKTNQSAKNNLAKVIAKKKQVMSEQAGVIRVLEQMEEPILSSTYAYGYAHWQKEEWSDGMKHAYHNLVEMADDNWHGYVFSQEDWERIGGFDQLIKAYEQARADKQEIIARQKLSLLPDAQESFGRWQFALQQQIHQRIEELEQGDLQSLNKKQADYERRLNALDTELKAVLQQFINDITKEQTEVKKRLNTLKNNNNEVQTHVGTTTKTKHRTIESGLAKLGRFLSFGWYDGRRTESYEVSVNYYYASVPEAVDNLVNFSRHAERNLRQKFNVLIDQKTIKHRLRQAVVQEAQMLDNPLQFRTLIEQSIEHLKLPRLQMSLGDVGALISGQFDGNQTKNPEYLQSCLNQALDYVQDALWSEFYKKSTQVRQQLTDIQQSLVVSLTQDLNKELEQTKKDMQDGETAIISYKNLQKLLI